MADNFDHNFESATGQLAIDRPARILTDVKVDIGKASVKENIPFIMGVIAPLRGDRSATTSEAVARRDFRQISAQNFNEVMKDIKPVARIEVDDVLSGGDKKLGVELTFESMSEFSPAAVARKIEPLRHLLELRTQLKEVRQRFGSNPEAKATINTLMETIFKDPKLVEQLRSKLAQKPAN